MNISKQELNRLVLMLEKVTGKKVTLKETDDALRNLASQALKTLSESIEMSRTNIATAIEKVQELNLGDVSITQLQGISSTLDANLTTVSEIITSVTGMQTTQQHLGATTDDGSMEVPMEEAALHEDADGDDQAIEMSMDDIDKNTEKVKNFMNKGMNVRIDDNDLF